jgi:hypothetical protein
MHMDLSGVGLDWMSAITNRIEQDRSVTCIGC